MACGGTGKMDGHLCGWCGVTKICSQCRGTGQVRPRPFTVATPPGVEPQRAQYACARLAEAVAAMDEVLKFIPAGDDTVPGSAFRSQAGIDLYLADPDRFSRARLTVVADVYRSGVRDYDRELAARAEKG